MKFKLKNAYKNIFNKKLVLLKEMSEEARVILQQVQSSPESKLIAIRETDLGGEYIFKVSADFRIEDFNRENMGNIQYLMFIEKGAWKRINTEIDNKINSSVFEPSRDQDDFKRISKNINSIIALAYNKVLKDEVRKSLVTNPDYNNPVNLIDIVKKLSNEGLGENSKDFDEHLKDLIKRHVKQKYENNSFTFDLSKIIKGTNGKVTVNFDLNVNENGEINDFESLNLNEAIKTISSKLIKSNTLNNENNIAISSGNEDLVKVQRLQTIIDEYSSVDFNYVSNKYLNTDGKFIIESQLRESPESIDKIIEKLNTDDTFVKDLRSLPNKGGSQGKSKGKGEAALHVLFNTTNVCTREEPDAIIRLSNNNLIKCSVKDFNGDAQTGTNMTNDLQKAYREFSLSIFTTEARKMTKPIMNDACVALEEIIKNNNENYSTIEGNLELKNLEDLRAEDIKEKFISFKNEICKEHGAEYIIGFRKDEYYYRKVDDKNIHSSILVASIPINKRVRFRLFKSESEARTFDSSSGRYTSGLESNIERFIKILEEYKESNDNDEILNNEDQENSSYKPQGKVLKEIYSNLFKKKLIKEGGLAGHMMHPYEALDMTPRQIIDRIKEYSTSQKIIEKVDGQNLFFTVEEDGTLMFARNKQDMTHDDLVKKFTGHGAEKPFVEGGNAIKRGVEQWLQSAGPAAEMEIREIFHPDEETKSFINFEIMHPDKPNQIIYDKKYIVFHSIVDYIDGRKTIHSTNKGQRLEKAIRLMDSGISSAGFTLASNRTVNLNELTSVQIEDYVNRIKKVAQQLNIFENEFLGDGIEKQIKLEIEKEGISISEESVNLICDFALYGETKAGNKIKSRDFTSMMSKEDAAKLRSIGLTSSAKALKKVQSIISPFKEIFVDLGIDLLKGVKSAYMSDKTNQMNIDMLKDKLQTAVDDLTRYTNKTPEKFWEAEVYRLKPHLDKVLDVDINSIVSTAVEGGVYDNQGDLLKVTGGFAPLNQILGAAYRDKKGIFPTFKEKFMKQESNRRSLKSVFNLIY